MSNIRVNIRNHSSHQLKHFGIFSALNWLRGDVAVHGEMEEMHQEAEKNKVSKKITLRELLVKRQLRQPLLIAIIVMIAQQLSGINVVIFFSTDIFRKANLSDAQSQYATLGMGAMNVVMTVISLLLVEIAGRKTLLLTGFLGMFFCTIAITAALLFVSIQPKKYDCSDMS
ncbi:hypothetical protein O3G_MSEX011660 [Manduca sexta]|uniref:Uncharacterized protein n=1 Tax=Manduca sexta TaxID=7130 RepID=A0A921ZMB1_MANSE|nr:hypothetical protein O3G_MSEX011660 [Manduca sexta]